MGKVENTQLLYLAFDEYRFEKFVAEIRSKVVNQITSELFNEVINGYYGNYKFETNFSLIKGTGIFAPLYVKIQNGYNAVSDALASIEGFKPQKTISISLKKNTPAIMKSIDLPEGRIINKDPQWVIFENKIVFLDTLEIFDLAFIQPYKNKVTMEYRGYYGKFCIREINGQRILIVQVESNKYILWNFNENRPFLYEENEQDLDVICVNDRKDTGYDNWGGRWCPHIFLRNADMENLPDNEKIYDVYYDFYAGKTKCITSIGKPHILKCRDGKVVYFIKTYNEENHATGMMFVLDEEYNLVESRENVNLISVYDGNAVSGLKFVFVESN